MARGLLRHARLSRRQLIMFALASAAINGIITATVGAWLAQTYSTYQGRRQSIETIAHLVYERRTRAGMVASAIRRDADIEEVRHRKQAYDEAYVDWNKNVMLNLFAIREVAGDLKFSALEPVFEDHLIAAMADVDRCITQGLRFAAHQRRRQGRAQGLPHAGAAPVRARLRRDVHQRALQAHAADVHSVYERVRRDEGAGEQAHHARPASRTRRSPCSNQVRRRPRSLPQRPRQMLPRMRRPPPSRLRSRIRRLMFRTPLRLPRSRRHRLSPRAHKPLLTLGRLPASRASLRRCGR